jgi:DNA-binding MarR family transcriptional regulator
MDLYYELMSTIRRLYVQIRDIENTPQYFNEINLWLYPSEINTVAAIGKEPDVNVTELAGRIGVTKGAVSQIIKKLNDKKLVEKYHDENNKKEVLLKLTVKGNVVFQEHKNIHKVIDPQIRSFLAAQTNEQTVYLIEFLKMLSEICKEIKV